MTLKLKNISKSFGSNTVLNNVNLTIENGDFFVLLGPSGCGKTTLLRIIAGLESLDNGVVYLNNSDITKFSPMDRDFSMVFQYFALYPTMRVFDNIAYPLRLKSKDKYEINSKVNKISERLQINHLLKRYPKKLSGGEVQRVSLAKAMVRSPKLFLLDEPLSNIDSKLRISMRYLLRELHEEFRVTNIMVTHDQEEALSLGTRIGIMNKGRIQQVGTPEEIYDRPSNLFTASFIGNHPINLLDLKATSNNTIILDGKIIQSPTNYLKLIQEKIIKGSMNRETILGVRPEDIKIINTNDSTINFTITILSIESFGSYNLIKCKMSTSNTVILISEHRNSIYKRVVNEVVNISFDRIHLFDSDTNKRVDYGH